MTWSFEAIRSLRVRLLISLMIAICTIWASWFLCQAVQMSRQQSGHWDQMMQAVGQQILLSMPPGLSPAAPDAALALPAAIPAVRERLSYQVWRRDGQVMLRSSEAPAVPWVPLQFDAPHWLGHVDVAGAAWRVYTISDASGRVQVQVGKSQAHLDAEIALWLQGSVLVAGLLIVLLGAVSWWTICWTMRPVRQMRDALQARAPLDMRPVSIQSLPQELRPMVEGFNMVLGQLDTALRAERHFLADAAHELRTPLAVLTAQARLVQSAQSLEESRAAVAPLVCGIERTARLTQQLLDSARLDAAPDGGVPAVALHEVVSLVMHDFDATARQAQQRLMIDAEPCALPIDVDTLGVLLRNLVDNALRYGGPGARIQVVCRRARLDGDRWCVALGVRDDGPGVPVAEHQRIFDRFYRVPGSMGRGSGIGLSLVSRIAELHGALIDVGPGLDGRGFGITVRFAAHPVDAPASCEDSGPMPLSPVLGMPAG